MIKLYQKLLDKSFFTIYNNNTKSNEGFILYNGEEMNGNLWLLQN